MLHYLIAAGVAVLTGGASAEPAQTQFRMAGVNFIVPLPDGYCLPTGKDIDVSQAMAAADSENVTHAMLVRCDNDELMDYYILKTPKQVMMAQVSMADFLSAMGEAFANPAMKKLIHGDEIEKVVERDLNAVLGTKVDFVGEIKPLGQDDQCAYLGGIGDFSNIPKPYKIAIGACMTVVSNKVITVYSYGPRTDQVGVINELKKAHNLAAEISATPAL